jgi:hypothetical protein
VAVGPPGSVRRVNAAGARSCVPKSAGSVPLVPLGARLPSLIGYSGPRRPLACRLRGLGSRPPSLAPGNGAVVGVDRGVVCRRRCRPAAAEHSWAAPGGAASAAACCETPHGPPAQGVATPGANQGLLSPPQDEGGRPPPGLDEKTSTDLRAAVRPDLRRWTGCSWRSLTQQASGTIERPVEDAAEGRAEPGHPRLRWAGSWIGWSTRRPSRVQGSRRAYTSSVARRAGTSPRRAARANDLPCVSYSRWTWQRRLQRGRNIAAAGRSLLRGGLASAGP